MNFLDKSVFWDNKLWDHYNGISSGNNNGNSINFNYGALNIGI
jgi:hypothetical protein